MTFKTTSGRKWDLEKLSNFILHTIYHYSLHLWFIIKYDKNFYSHIVYILFGKDRQEKIKQIKMYVSMKKMTKNIKQGSCVRDWREVIIWMAWSMKSSFIVFE